MAARIFRIALAVIFLAAGLALTFGFDRMGHRFAATGLPVVLRLLGGVAEIGAGVFLLIPGRSGYGAALGLAVSLAALAAHAAVLGWDSAPPAMVTALASALLLRQHRTDFRR